MSEGTVQRAEDSIEAAAEEAGAHQVSSVLAVTVALVTALVVAGLSQRRALSLAGMPRSSWHYLTRPRPGVTDPVLHTQRRAASWLSEAEREVIGGKLRAAFELGYSVYHAFYLALDAGDPVASLSPWYRIARDRLEAQRPVRRGGGHKHGPATDDPRGSQRGWTPPGSGGRRLPWRRRRLRVRGRRPSDTGPELVRDCPRRARTAAP